MRAYQSEEGFFQLFFLFPQFLLGEVSECRGVIDTIDERLDHCPAVDTEDICCHRAELDPGAFESFLDTVNLSGAFFDQAFAVAEEFS